jgi:RNA polymerase sigma factor (sigma-70 family)
VKILSTEHTPQSWTDARLVEQCLDGDAEAWSALIDKYRNLIYSIPIKYGFSSEDADDIFQDVCLTILSELRKLRDTRTLAAWIIRITANKCFHSQTRRKQRQPLDFDEEASHQTVEPELPGEMVNELMREQMLRESVTQLASRCRQLIEMLFFSEPQLRYDQVASNLGIAKGSVGFIRMRCLERLRKSLEQKGFS